MPTKNKPKKPKTKPKPKKTKPKQKQKQKQTTNVRQIVNINRPVRKRVVYRKRPFQIAHEPVMNLKFPDGFMNQSMSNFVSKDTLEAAVKQASKSNKEAIETAVKQASLINKDTLEAAVNETRAKAQESFQGVPEHHF